MSLTLQAFASDISRCMTKWSAYPDALNELDDISNALSSDGVTHDMTIHTPMAELQVSGAQTPFTNAINLIVNQGKAGNLASSDMANAMASVAAPPAIFNAPVVSGGTSVGSTLSSTTGDWEYFPTSYAYQWMRQGAAISGATSASYTTVSADSGDAITCQVTATNFVGSSAALSNSVTVASGS